MTVVLDSGALIAIDRKDRSVGAILRMAQETGTPVVTSAGALAQVWRAGARQANLARVLAGVRVVALDEADGRRVGELLAKTKSSDVVDAHVALQASPGDRMLTGDLEDLRSLLATRGVDVAVIRV